MLADIVRIMMNNETRHHRDSATVWRHHTRGILYDTELLGKHQLAVTSELFEPSFWQASQSLTAMKGGRGRVYFIDAGECHWVLRHYRRGGLIGKLIADRYLWSGAERTRAFREWRLLAQLYAQGLPVPQPVAARYQRQGFSYQADLIMVAIKQARTLTQCLETEALSESVWQHLGEVLARFHAAGIQHADLNAHNIVFDAQKTVYLLDFDRGQVRDVRPAWVEGVLQRLLRSLNKLKKERNIHFEMQNWAALRQAHDTALNALIQR